MFPRLVFTDVAREPCGVAGGLPSVFPARGRHVDDVACTDAQNTWKRKERMAVEVHVKVNFEV